MSTVVSRPWLRVNVVPGVRYLMQMPCTEACMHLRVVDKYMHGELLPGGRMVQLYREDGRPFSFPITAGEAGMYYDQEAEAYYFYERFYEVDTDE
jgi:hypothetical protein